MLTDDKWVDKTVRNQVCGNLENGYLQFNDDQKIYIGQDFIFPQLIVEKICSKIVYL